MSRQSYLRSLCIQSPQFPLITFCTQRNESYKYSPVQSICTTIVAHRLQLFCFTHFIFTTVLHLNGPLLSVWPCGCEQRHVRDLQLTSESKIFWWIRKDYSIAGRLLIHTA